MLFSTVAAISSGAGTLSSMKNATLHTVLFEIVTEDNAVSTQTQQPMVVSVLKKNRQTFSKTERESEQLYF